MYSTRLLAFVLAGSVLAPQLVWAQQPAAPPAATASVQQPAPANALAQRVREAQDPSTAIQAYADARAAAPNDFEVQRAFVHRMAEFGLPEMADQQAQELLTHAPDDAVAWAVTGYVAAKRNQMDAAATDLVSAAQLAPDDPFVQRTGAQIVAWADSRKDKTEVSPQTLVAIGTIRSKLSGKPEFAQAYQEALDAYQRLASTAATQPATPSPSEPVTAAPTYESVPGPTYYNPDVVSSGYAPAYVTPYYYSDYSYAQPYWYPSSIAGSYWWWPTASSFIIVDNSCRDVFRHHRDRDFDHHHDRDFGSFRSSDRSAQIRDPDFFSHRGSFARRSSFDHRDSSDHRGQFGDWTDPQRHFAMSPADRGSRTTLTPRNDERGARSGDAGRSFTGIRTSPSLAPSRTFSPAVTSGSRVLGGERVTRSEPRVFSPAVTSGSRIPGGERGERVTRSEPRVVNPAVPSGRPIYGGERITRSAPQVVAPGRMVSPGGRSGWSGASEAPRVRSSSPVESHAQPARATMSPSDRGSGGFSGPAMSHGGGGGGGRRR